MPKTFPALFCVAIGVLCSASNLFAQLGRYDPYAKPVDDLPPIAEDGTLHWPTYFRSAAMEARYQNLWHMGACGGTNKSITIPVEKNKLNIDTLPEVTIVGRVLKVDKGGLLVQQTDGQVDMIVTHPAGVSRIDVTGDVPASWLKNGMLVKLIGQVDEEGHGVEPIDSIDVISSPGDFAPPEVEPGVRRNVIAVVKSLRGKTLVVQTSSGTLRKLTFTLSDDAIAHLMTKAISFTTVGDEVSVTGHLYAVADGKPQRRIFASDVNVTKQPLLTAGLGDVAKAGAFVPGLVPPTAASLKAGDANQSTSQSSSGDSSNGADET